MNNYLDRLETHLEKILNETVIPAPLVRDAIHYTLLSGGKRIRPQLVYLGGELLNLPLEILDVIAAAIELTHCYSLIHDDLPAMDNDDFRRGKLSCHKAFDEATAILAGDGLQALALEHLLSLVKFLPAATVISVCHELLFASGVQGMISGQSLDLSILSHASVNEAQLRQIHQLKTGKLISACFNMILAAAPDTSATTKQSLRDFATHLGLVFQMQDDYLDHYAATDVLGKKQSSDLANQKSTFATLYTQKDLAQLVNDEFKLAYQALEIFGDKAQPLFALTQHLQQRSKT